LKLVLEEPDILGLNDGPSDNIDNDSMLIYLPLITEVECLLNFASIM